MGCQESLLRDARAQKLGLWPDAPEWALYSRSALLQARPGPLILCCPPCKQLPKWRPVSAQKCSGSFVLQPVVEADHTEFQTVPRIAGCRGERFREIARTTGAVLHLRGRRSLRQWHLNFLSKEPLQLEVSCEDHRGYELACAQAKSLLTNLSSRYVKFREQKCKTIKEAILTTGQPFFVFEHRKGRPPRGGPHNTDMRDLFPAAEANPWSLQDFGNFQGVAVGKYFGFPTSALGASGGSTMQLAT